MDNQNNNQYNNQYNGQPNNGYGQPNYNQQYNNGYNQGYNGQQYNQGYQQGPTGDWNQLREEKSVATCVILSIVTCGIYTWFWMYSLIKKMKTLCGEGDDMIGEYLLLILVPYYNIYWVYNRGKKIAEAAARYGIQVTDNSVLYLILNICGFQIVSYAMLQNEMNNIGKRI